jgi:hypothetical protein
MGVGERKLMDVVFVIDATGSMGPTINAAHNKASEIANTLRGKDPDVDFMFGSVCYRDPIDSHGDVHQIQQLDSDINHLVAFLSGIAPTGGGDSPEDWVGAYRLALDDIKWRDGAKAVVHIADAPAHGQKYCGYANHEDESEKLEPLLRELAKRQILVTCLDINEGASVSFAACKRIYEDAGGPQFTIEPLSLRGSLGVRSADSYRLREVALTPKGKSFFGWLRSLFVREAPMEDVGGDSPDVIETGILAATSVVCDCALEMHYGE